MGEDVGNSTVPVDRLTVAHHEAGHAVVSRVLGVGVRYVSVEDQPAGRAGVCVGYTFGCAPDASAETVMRAAQKHVCVFFAGQLAEARFSGREPHNWSHEADDAGALELATRACGSGEEAGALLTWLFIRARNKVSAHWYQIEAVAAELVVRGRLTGPEVDEIILGATLARLRPRA